MQEQQHYYTADPQTPHRPGQVALHTRTRGIGYLATDSGVFSRSAVDYGSRVLLASLPELHGQVLDLGCGYGPIGLTVAIDHPQVEQVTLVDINHRSLDLCRQNAQQLHLNAEIIESDGFAALSGRTFDAILTNPPIRAGNAVFFPWFAQAVEHLNDQGLLIVVARKKQGAPSIQKAIAQAFGQCDIIQRDSGYWILAAQKNE